MDISQFLYIYIAQMTAYNNGCVDIVSRHILFICISRVRSIVPRFACGGVVDGTLY